MGGLVPISQKLNRAQEHLDALNAELDAWDNRHPYRIGCYPNAEGTQHTVMVIAHEEIPTRLSLILGDFLYDLRASLDYMVWELVKANGKSPGFWNAFPIFLCEGEKFDQALGKRLSGVPAEAIAVIRELQPHAGRGIGDPYHPLWVLEKLSNFDKHRTLHLIACIPEGVRLTTPSDFPGGNVAVFENVRVIEHGTVLAVFLTPPHRKMKMDGQLSVSVRIDETPETPELAWGVLDAMVDSVRDAVGWLSRFL